MIDAEKNLNKDYLMRNIMIVLCMMVAFPAGDALLQHGS
jgi:hypothetical protein